MSESAYFPGPGDQWERRTPAQVGLDAAGLDAAAQFATDHETAWSRDIRTTLTENNRGEGPHGAIVGPIAERGGVSGVVLRHGYRIFSWGDPSRVDMPFSVAKSSLAPLRGLALDRGLTRDLDEPVRESVNDGGFDP